VAEDKKTVLVVGGSSGLGLELALQLVEQGWRVIVTGRTNPNKENVDFRMLDLSFGSTLIGDLDAILDSIPVVDTLIYAAGFNQVGTITDISDQGILDTCSVGIIAPAMILQRLLNQQDALARFVAITSTSQWTPRLMEPVYAASKAALALFAESVSLDDRVSQTLVFAPSGMQTPFWDGDPRDTSTMLDPKWVAEQLLTKLFSKTVAYEFVICLREPAHIKIEKTRLV
jgi:NAD(P)-dependent dehydrogenase (short-subunit alcohol dehydrogenase family)